MFLNRVSHNCYCTLELQNCSKMPFPLSEVEGGLLIFVSCFSFFLAHRVKLDFQDHLMLI